MLDGNDLLRKPGLLERVTENFSVPALDLILI